MSMFWCAGLMLLASASIFTYYTIWTLATPFFPPSAAIHEYFPDREWAVRIPAAALLIFMAAIGTLISLVLFVIYKRLSSSHQLLESLLELT